jgi:transketolase
MHGFETNSNAPGWGLALREHELNLACDSIRHAILSQSLRSNVGHIGSALSIVEMIAVLWLDVMHEPATTHPDRDRFILAKGHASLAMYAAMLHRDLITQTQFESYCQDDSLFGVHPEFGIPGVEVATGSLGQGLSVGCGIALALKRKQSKGRVFVLMSDAECNEGQVWEAAMFAAHHHLDNVIGLVDLNGMQAMGHTNEILDMPNLAERWAAFGWDTHIVDGHDIGELQIALNESTSNRPKMIIAQTTLGKGVSFMEDRLEWHYRNLTIPLASQALAELED